VGGLKLIFCEWKAARIQIMYRHNQSPWTDMHLVLWHSQMWISVWTFVLILISGINDYQILFPIKYLPLNMIICENKQRWHRLNYLSSEWCNKFELTCQLSEFSLQGLSSPVGSSCCDLWVVSYYITVQCHNPEDHDMNLHRHENLKLVVIQMVKNFAALMEPDFCDHLYSNPSLDAFQESWQN
jgi:hypothetical protein